MPLRHLRFPRLRGMPLAPALICAALLCLAPGGCGERAAENGGKPRWCLDPGGWQQTLLKYRARQAHKALYVNMNCFASGYTDERLASENPGGAATANSSDLQRARQSAEAECQAFARQSPTPCDAERCVAVYSDDTRLVDVTPYLCR